MYSRRLILPLVLMIFAFCLIFVFSKPNGAKPKLIGDTELWKDKCELGDVYCQRFIMPGGKKIELLANKKLSKEEWQAHADKLLKTMKSQPKPSDCFSCHYENCGRNRNGEEGQKNE